MKYKAQTFQHSHSLSSSNPGLWELARHGELRQKRRCFPREKIKKRKRLQGGQGRVWKDFITSKEIWDFFLFQLFSGYLSILGTLMLDNTALKSAGGAGRSCQRNLKHCRSWKQGLTPGGDLNVGTKIFPKGPWSAQLQLWIQQGEHGTSSWRFKHPAQEPALDFCQAGHNHPQLNLGKAQQSISREIFSKSPSKGSSRAAFSSVELMETTKGCREVEGTSFHPARQCWPWEHVT